jgi:RNA polymerase sigma factor (sigma-70 family)
MPAVEPTDFDLLHEYTRQHSQAAFAALVHRHLNLVYSAARRQVQSVHLAEEIAQNVFLDLSRQARRIDPQTPLAAWLFTVTRRSAVDVLRRESRRRAREHTAMEIAAMHDSPSDWSQLEPVLDEAMTSLGEADRRALLLRFFENKSLREVGDALGLGDDAAQKRVSRALERLRRFFSQRGLAVGASSLAASLSAHAVGAAPAGLSTTIASAAMFTAGSATAVGAGHFVAVSTLQKTAASLAVAAALALGVFEVREIFCTRAALHRARETHARLANEVGELESARDATAARLDQVEQQIDARLGGAAPAVDLALEKKLSAWLADIDLLKRTFAARPELAVPELALLKEHEWIEVVSARRLETDAQVRQAMAQLRRRAQNLLAEKLPRALTVYLAQHDGMLPDTPQQLAAWCEPPVDPHLFSRYELLHRGKMSDVPDEFPVRAVLRTVPADPEYDMVLAVGPSGFAMIQAVYVDVQDAQRKFAAANRGARASSAEQLQPFLRWAADPAEVQRTIERQKKAAQLERVGP